MQRKLDRFNSLVNLTLIESSKLATLAVSCEKFIRNSLEFLVNKSNKIGNEFLEGSR